MDSRARLREEWAASRPLRVRVESTDAVTARRIRTQLLAQGIEPSRDGQPDVVIALAEEASLDRLRQLAAGGTAVLLVARSADAAGISRAVDTAAALANARRGEAPRPADARRGEAPRPADARREALPPSELDAGERAIVSLLAGGATTRQLAAELNYSERTIKLRIRLMCDRYGTVNRAQLVNHATRRGWV